MNITQLKSFSYTSHRQACQTLAHVLFESGREFVGIYDSSNGHWLSLPHWEEVGYLSDFHINGTNERAKHITQIIPGKEQT